MNGNFQATSKQQGDWFEQTSKQVLVDAGFRVDALRERIHDAGVEVDIIATNRHEISFYITCKGSYRGNRPGAKRTDTLKKAITDALMLHHQGWGPVLLLTSHKPSGGAGKAMVGNIDPEILFDIIDPIADFKRLEWLADANEYELRSDMYKRRTLFVAERPHKGFGSWRLLTDIGGR